MKKAIIIPLFIFVFIASCKENVECLEQQELPLVSLEDAFGCQDTRYGLDINLVENNAIIHSQSEFEDRVSGSCNPDIDFSKYDLLIGKKGLSSGNSSINYSLKRMCPENNLVLNVTFNQNITAEAPNITYHALIPKLKKNEIIIVNTEVK